MTTSRSDRLTKKVRVRRYMMPPGKLIVRRDQRKEKTSGGLHVPETATMVEFTGVVESVGDGVGCKPGDRICYGAMYQMLNQAGPDAGTIVLKWPDEVMYVFEDTEVEREETDEEYEARATEENAARSLAAERTGRLSA